MNNNDNTVNKILNMLNESELNESSDANQEFLSAFKDLLNKYCRTNINTIELSQDGNTVTVNGKQINIEANSNLATIKAIAEALLK